MHRLTKPTVLVLAMLLAAVALAACGGDDDSTSTDTTQGTPLTEADFAAQANAICKEGNQTIADAGAELPADADEADLTAFAEDTVIPSIQSQVNAIQELGFPEGQVEEIDAFVEDTQDALEEVENDPSLLVADDGTEGGVFAEVNKQAEALGLTECAG